MVPATESAGVILGGTGSSSPLGWVVLLFVMGIAVRAAGPLDVDEASSSKAEKLVAEAAELDVAKVFWGSDCLAGSASGEEVGISEPRGSVVVGEGESCRGRITYRPSTGLGAFPSRRLKQTLERRERRSILLGRGHKGGGGDISVLERWQRGGQVRDSV